MARYVDPGRIPGPVYIPGCVSVRLFWRLGNGKQAYNVLHASYSSVPAFNTNWINTLGTAIKGALGTSGLASALDVNTKLQQVGVRDMAIGPNNSGYGEWVSATTEAAGTASGGFPLPSGTAFVVSLKTGFSRQANRGRVYLPGFNSTVLEAGGLIGDDDKQNCVDFVTAVKDALSNVSLTLCIAQPARQAYTGVTGVQYPARAANKITVTNIVALNNYFDSQRLRSRV